MCAERFLQDKKIKRLEQNREASRLYYDAARALDAAGQDMLAQYKSSPAFGRSLPSLRNIVSFIVQKTKQELGQLAPQIAADLVGLKAGEFKQRFDALVSASPPNQIPELPNRAPARYRGKRWDGDPLAFLKTHCQPWIDARVLDQPTLRRLDPPLYHAVTNLRDQTGARVPLSTILPGVVEARGRREALERRHPPDWTPQTDSEVLRRTWRTYQRRSRARKAEK